MADERSDRTVMTAFGILTVATGLIDAATVLKMDVFAANMTGNLVFLGFSLGGSDDYSVRASIGAIGGFAVGAFVAGLLFQEKVTPRDAARALWLQTIILIVSAAIFLSTGAASADQVAGLAALVLMSAGMGLQNAVAQETKGGAGMKTTVMTLTLTALASNLARGKLPGTGIKLASFGLLILGAALGAALVLGGSGPGGAALAAAALVAIAAAIIARASPGSAGAPADDD